MGDRPGLDRRSFLGFATATGAVAVTGAVAAGCRGSSSGPAISTATPPAPEPPPSADELANAGPVRLAIVPDEVAPAFAFVPLRQDRR